MREKRRRKGGHGKPFQCSCPKELRRGEPGG